MPRKLILILAFVFFLNFPQGVFANVLINEVQIGVEGNANDEFIELYNNGSSEVDLTGFSIYKKTSSGAESSVVSKSRFDSKKIPANGIVFLAREDEYTGSKTVDILWPNSYSLASNNSLTLYKDFESKTVEDTVSWGDVKNFKRSNTNTGTSPDSENNPEIEIDEVATNNILNSSSNFVSKTQKPTLKIISKNSGFVGVPMEFEARLESLEYKNLYAKYVWNFGDGSAVEFKDYENKKFSHTFYYAGEYLVSLEYYANPQQLSADYIAKINIKIIHPNILISSIGDTGNFYVEITNTSALDVDLGEWVLLGNNKSFTFPKNTNLLSMKKIILSPRITNFTIEDKNFLELLDKNRTVIFSYKNIINQKQNTGNNIVKYKNTNTILPKNNSTNDISPEYFIENYEEEFENHDISGAVILSDENPQQENNFIYIILFILLIGLAVFSIYFLRKNRGNKEEENQEDLEDFEILDE
ncbi:MAG: lamin tail domain-containing protein [Candidatus Paceibacterota bacterium]